MKKFRIALVLIFAFVFLFSLASSSFAKSINKRQKTQQVRIVNGIKGGSLRPWEVKHLEKQQASIAKQERYFKSDGVFTLKERAIIQKRLDNSSKNIFKKKHNRF